MGYYEFLRGTGLTEEDLTLEDFKGAVWYSRRKARIAGKSAYYADAILLPDVVAGIMFGRELERRCHEGA